MKKLPISIQHSVASHYHADARDFAERFDFLWEKQLHKTGRIKSFVDLAMACECALKCHIFLGRMSKGPEETYRLVRRAGHNARKLSELATFLQDRSIYELLGEKLSPFSVLVRYSLDAYSTFFPALVDRTDAAINYTATIGNSAWVICIRNDLDRLIKLSSPEFSGVIDDDIGAILQHEIDMEKFMQKVAPNNSFKPTPLRGAA